jgi:hypothetical protein
VIDVSNDRKIADELVAHARQGEIVPPKGQTRKALRIYGGV